LDEISKFVGSKTREFADVLGFDVLSACLVKASASSEYVLAVAVPSAVSAHQAAFLYEVGSVFFFYLLNTTEWRKVFGYADTSVLWGREAPRVGG
jgi:hypothetical protein